MREAERAQQVGRTAREQASATTAQAGQAAGEVAGTAAEQAKAVAGEARRQADSAVHDLKRRLMDEGQEQTDRLADAVRQWADDLGGLADGARKDSPARSLTARTADQGHRAADYLAGNSLDGMLGDLRDFGRRRPGVFLGGAVLAGLAVGRLGKAGKAAHSSDGGRPAAEHQEVAPLGPGSPAPAELPRRPGV
ncbi:hypothetical protein ABZ371_31550 [Streptomyces sp. NPDC005899]|uniref:hypothetical protein n=1 Tax=Streptomyces sp. NPDC005899 TaxID=3155716 RepID=UPI0033CAFC70